MAKISTPLQTSLSARTGNNEGRSAQSRKRRVAAEDEWSGFTATAAKPMGRQANSQHQTNVFCVAGSRIQRSALVRSLGHLQMNVVGEAGSLNVALPSLRQFSRHIIVLVLSHALRDALAEGVLLPGSPRFVALCSTDNEEEIIAVAEAGVAAIIDCDTPERELASIFERVLLGEFRCSSRTAATLLHHISKTSPSAIRHSDPHGPRMTPREQQVYSLLADGLSNKEIASALGVQLATVKNHVHRLLEKLGVRSRGAAAALGIAGDKSRLA